ncbi:MAG: hypothetical protein U0174_14125 [Polyangiaceae bacterium]
MNTTKNADKSLNLNLRRVRTPVKTSVSTGAARAVRTTQGNGQCGYSITTG